MLPFQGAVLYTFSFTQGVAPSGRCHWAMLFWAFSPKIRIDTFGSKNPIIYFTVFILNFSG